MVMKCGNCGEPYNNGAWEMAAGTDGLPKLMCPKCGTLHDISIVDSSLQRNTYRAYPSPNNEYQCVTCGKTFATQALLDAHRRKEHSVP